MLKFAQLYVNFKILQTALQSLKYTVDSVAKSFEDARKVYAKSATSGYGIKGTVKMGILSSIIGVSEQDVLKFGSAINYLNPRIEHASKILSDTALPLTQVSYNIEILKTDLSALFAKMTAEAAPAINNFLVGLDDLVKRITDHANSMGTAGKTAQIASSFLSGGSALGIGLIVKAIQTHGAIITAVSKAPKNLEAPMTFMKQIPASSWEKMGLVIGGKGNTTNELIRQSNKHLSTIAAAVTGTGVARQSFGMNPTVANP